MNNEVGRLVCRHWIYVFWTNVFLKQVKMTVFSISIKAHKIKKKILKRYSYEGAGTKTSVHVATYQCFDPKTEFN